MGYPCTMSREYKSWGRLTTNNYTNIIQIDNHLQATSSIFSKGEQYLSFGNGRSYGDVAYNDKGIILDGISSNRFIEFDRNNGVLVAESGITLREILQLIVPCGWFLAVTPGTQFITLGGAVANDVHGKNHHCDGSFGNFTLEFELLRSDGSRLVCSRLQNPEYFYATIGGIGLTGYISWVKIQLAQIQNSYIVTNAYRFNNLHDFFALNSQLEDKNKYTVSWIDCATSMSQLGRGIYFTGEHAGLTSEHIKHKHKHKSKTFPFDPPFSLVNSLSLKAFNFLYYNKSLKNNIEHYEPFFYPLDSLYKWNRIYGKSGFYQYQCVVPMDNAYDCILAMLREIKQSGLGSFLAVLKTFGDKVSGGVLSFPRRGVTLALDFPNAGDKTLELFTKLDNMLHDAGGALYMAKDARMNREMFLAGYPRINEFLKYKDPQFSSNLWRRVCN